MFLKAVVGVYVVALVAAAVVLHVFADRWWVATVLLFAPRWILGLPVLVLVPAALTRQPRLLAPVAAAMLLLLGPVMGFNAPDPRAFLHRGGPADLRLMTCNLGGGARLRSNTLVDDVLRMIEPDVAAFQECGVALDRLVAAGWFVHSGRRLCVVSRYPILRVTERDRADVRSGGGHGAATEYVLATPGGATALLNLHLATVRHGLEEVASRGWRGAADLAANIDLRRFESRVVRDFATRTRPASIVVGDFNIPVESAIYREVWPAWTNAFSRAGVGFGWTKYTRWHGIRIDHVLYGPEWDCRRAWVGPSLGLDHRPLVAELTRRPPVSR